MIPYTVRGAVLHVSLWLPTFAQRGVRMISMQQYLRTYPVMSLAMAGLCVIAALAALNQLWLFATGATVALLILNGIGTWRLRRWRAAQALVATNSARVRDALLVATQQACQSDAPAHTLFPALTQLAVQGFADWCAIATVAGDGSLTLAAVAAADPARAAMCTQLLRYALPADAPMSYPAAIRTRQTEFVHDVPPQFIDGIVIDPQFQALLLEMQVASMITVPLIVAQRTIGAATFIRSAGNAHYTLIDRQTAERWAQQLTHTLDHTDLVQQARRQVNELGAVRQLAHTLLQQPQLPAIVAQVVTQIHATLDYQLVSVYFLEANQLVLQAQVGYDSIMPTIPLVGSASGRVVRSGRAELIADATTDPEFLIDQPGVTQGLVVPLRHNDGTIYGALLVESTGSPLLTHADLQLMELLAEHIDIAANYARLADQLSNAELTLQAERNLFTQGPVVLFRWGTEVGWPIQFVSTNIAQLGYDAAALMAQQTRFASLLPADDYRQLMVEVRQFGREQRRVYQHRYRINTVDGSTRWVNDLTLIQYTPDGQLSHYDGYLIDITAQIEASVHRQALERQLQTAHRVESLGRLAAGVAHDFNNLLNVILGNVTMIEIEHPGDQQLRESMADIRQASRKATDLIQQILTFAGQGRITPTQIQLNAIVHDVVRHVRGTLSSSVQITLDLDPALPQIRGDRVQLQQVLINLMTNAAESFDASGGTIVLTTGQQLITQHHTLAPGSYLSASVRDAGHGIDPAIQSRIFDLFFTTRPDNRGIGLATVNGVVRQHGGAVEFSSQPGEGSLFTVLLPVDDAEIA